MYGKIKSDLQEQLKDIRDAGLYKDERIIVGPQGAQIKVKSGQEVLNFCANNYLGLSGHPKVIAAAKQANTANQVLTETANAGLDLGAIIADNARSTAIGVLRDAPVVIDIVVTDRAGNIIGRNS